MKNIRLISNFGESDAIVMFRMFGVLQLWVVTPDNNEPTNLQLVKLKEQIK